MPNSTPPPRPLVPKLQLGNAPADNAFVTPSLAASDPIDTDDRDLDSLVGVRRTLSAGCHCWLV